MEDAFSLVWIKGELSNVAIPRSGHIYFTLKDESAQIRCAMFKGSNRRLDFTPTDGMAVLVKASVSIYVERGDYQLIVTHMEKWGIGQLQQAFEALKLKLQKQGFFDPARKKPLPRFPQHIGIITSPTGAAIQDILSVLKRRYPIAQVTIFPTQVQGKAATQAIVHAIQRANGCDLDVIILARGGGSLEDLWCFNEEAVACSIFACQIPIVSGVGHETDFTIADFVADHRAPTPSVAAETVTPDSLEVIQLFEHYKQRLYQAIERHLQHASLKLDRLEKQLVHPKRHLEQNKLLCDHLTQRLVAAIHKQCAQAQYILYPLSLRLKNQHPRLKIDQLKTRFDLLAQQQNRAMKQLLQLSNHRLAQVSNALQTISPLATLSRGYAIVMDHQQQHVIRKAGDLKVDQEVEVKLGEGAFVGKVKEIKRSSF